MSAKDAKDKTQKEMEELSESLPEESSDGAVMRLEATVDATPQKLRKTIKPFFKAQKDIPKTIPAEAQIVLHALFSCFDKQKEIKEGKMKDLVWGFEQSGIPPGATVVGIKQLENLGYMSLYGEDNGKVSIFSDHLPELWVKYENKLLDLVYEE